MDDNFSPKELTIMVLLVIGIFLAISVGVIALVITSHNSLSPGPSSGPSTGPSSGPTLRNPTSSNLSSLTPLNSTLPSTSTGPTLTKPTFTRPSTLTGPSLTRNNIDTRPITLTGPSLTRNNVDTRPSTSTKPTFTQPTFTQPTFTQPTFTQPTFTQPTFTQLSKKANVSRNDTDNIINFFDSSTDDFFLTKYTQDIVVPEQRIVRDPFDTPETTRNLIFEEEETTGTGTGSSGSGSGTGSGTGSGSSGTGTGTQEEQVYSEELNNIKITSVCEFSQYRLELLENNLIRAVSSIVSYKQSNVQIDKLFSFNGYLYCLSGGDTYVNKTSLKRVSLHWTKVTLFGPDITFVSVSYNDEHIWVVSNNNGKLYNRNMKLLHTEKRKKRYLGRTKDIYFEYISDDTIRVYPSGKSMNVEGHVILDYDDKIVMNEDNMSIVDYNVFYW